MGIVRFGWMGGLHFRVDGWAWVGSRGAVDGRAATRVRKGSLVGGHLMSRGGARRRVIIFITIKLEKASSIVTASRR